MVYSCMDEVIRRLSEENVVPVYREIDADLETPVSIFMKVRGDFLLESVERGDNAGRYSFIGEGVRWEFRLRGCRAEIIDSTGPGNPRVDTVDCSDPLAVLSDFMDEFRTEIQPGLPPFWGGLVGYLGYEIAGFYDGPAPFEPGGDDIPDAVLRVPRTVAVFDSVRRTVTAVAPVFRGGDPADAAGQAMADVDRMVEAIRAPLSESPVPDNCSVRLLNSEPDRDSFLEAVDRCRRCIMAGEIIQGVISRRLTLETDEHPFSIYRRLRRINPSPYMFYLDYGDFRLTGSSPEVMVRIQGEEIFLRPIAGTRPRGSNVAEDSAIAAELLADPKERAEHIMLVDLGRNDLGRVSVPGSISVTDYMTIERFSHVMHIVSSVRGLMRDDHNAFDAIKACFPAGTLTGAPKIRAMQLIRELEGNRRGPYGGMVLYLGFNGNLDSCINIRSMLWQGGRVTVQAGAGIVADSVPEREYRETENKADAVLCALMRGEEAGYDPAHR